MIVVRRRPPEGRLQLMIVEAEDLVINRGIVLRLHFTNCFE